jgi:hypothetical protein
MPTGEICRLALDWRLLTCSGKTPEATMASAMYGDIKRKDRHSLFIRSLKCQCMALGCMGGFSVNRCVMHRQTAAHSTLHKCCGRAVLCH